jgi:hypothetical protein
MRIKLLALALGTSLLFGLQQLAVAAPMTVPASASEIGGAQGGVVEPVYYVRRATVVRRGPVHGCAAGRRCVGGYYGGVCRRWAVCR